MKVRAWNVYSTIRENATVVCATDHEATTVTDAMDEAEDMARAWNAKEQRPEMHVTVLTCSGFIRTIPQQMRTCA